MKILKRYWTKENISPLLNALGAILIALAVTTYPDMQGVPHKGIITGITYYYEGVYLAHPKDGKRYYMANGNEAYRIMRYLGVGITNDDLNKVKNDKNFAKKHSGKIFLQVETNGEAFYIDFEGNNHYLKDGNSAYAIMRDLGLGITNNDLSKIPVGNL